MRERRDHGTVLESLSDEDFVRLEYELRGAVIQREEVVYVKPDVDYRIWSAFRSRYPDRYQDGAAEEWESVQRELTDATCACRDAASVDRELDEFVRTFPTSPGRPRIERRLRDLRAGRTDFRFDCHSG